MSGTLLPTIILSGGLARRLTPITDTIPKAMIEVNGEPFIAHQLRLLRAHEISRVVIAAGHLGDTIEAFVGDGRAFDLRVTFSFDGPQLLGTAGAIKKALPLLDEAFFVLYGDSYLPLDYRVVQAHFLESSKAALMTLYRNDGKWDDSNVEFSNGRLLAYDKRLRTDRMKHIDYGLGAFHQRAFNRVPPEQPCDLAQLYQELLAEGELEGYEVTQRFYEMGSAQGLEEFRNHLVAENQERSV